MSNRKAVPPKILGAGLIATAAGAADLVYLPVGAHVTGGLVVALGAVAVAGSTVWLVARRQASSSRVSRRERRAASTRGTAGVRDQAWGRLRQRGLAGVIRPDRAGERGRVRVREWATPVARANGMLVVLPLEHHTVRFGAPRSGKTSELATRVLDAPGAVVSTSTRLDVLDLTAGVRAQYGQVHLFNPGGDGGRVSTIKWTPVVGCRDILVAQRRAAALVPPSPSPEREGWANDARDQLAVLLHAAALVDAPARQVQRWVADLAGRDLSRVRAAVVAALETSQAAESTVTTFDGFASLNDRTRTSITQIMATAMRWTIDPRCAAIAEAAPSGELFDPADFFSGRNTLYLVGSDNGLHRPLTGALLDALAAAGRARAKANPHGRLSVPATLCLDEIKLTTTAELDSWTADFGGFGIVIHMSAQSLSQLRGIFGHDRSEEILGNVGAVILFRHGANVDDMRHWEQLAGTYIRPRETVDGSGSVLSSTPGDVATLPGWQMREFETGEAAVFVAGQRMVITQMPNVRSRGDVRKYAGSNPFRPAPADTAYDQTFGPQDAARLADEDAE